MIVSKFQKSVKIIRKEGVSEFVKRGLSFLSNQFYQNLPRQVLYSYAILHLLQENRSYTDARWLLNNKSDRHDALIGPKWNFHGPYVSFNSRAKHYYRYVFAANQINDLGGTGEVLDVASGTGYGVRVLDQKLSQTFDYTACEISREASLYGNKYYPKADFVQGDAQNLPFDSKSFDTIVSFETMEHLPDTHSYLQELRRVSKSGSNILISVPYDQDLDSESQTQRKTYPHVHSFDLEDIKSLMHEYFNQSDIHLYEQKFVKNPTTMSKTSGIPNSISKVKSSGVPDRDTNTLLIVIERQGSRKV